MTHVVILGGGFGGLAAAHELRQRLGDDDRITLVDRQDRFYMGFAKLWDLGDVRPLEEGTRDLTRLGARGVEFRQAEVTALDPDERTVSTDAGELQADAILVALGAGPAPHHRELLRGDGVHDLYDGQALPAIKSDLDEVAEGRVVVAVLGGPYKCPPAPYEAAMLVSERLRRRDVRDDVDVLVATPLPMALPPAGPDASRYVVDQLADHDVELLSDHRVQTVVPDRGILRFEDGSELDFTILLGVPANVAPRVVQDSALTGPSGWIEPDRHTLRTGFERVYAVGDCTHIPTATGALPMAGVFAASEAVVAARNIAVELTGEGEEATFDGHGHCFLELPGERVAFVEGDFYADPPDVEISPADHARFEQKLAFERERLDTWLG
ncbi:MAG: FAD-dependent oxidoreductase [Actinobacteria bacterium]|nr:FAD-dependent oxidoreductase [Actinomycetota bacterium]